MSIKIGVILGTPRTKSLGRKILNYLKNTMIKDDEVEYTWIDLRDYPLPFYDHEETPLSDPISGLDKAEEKWLNTLKEQDGYVILTPEYDHAIPGVLKNALDFIGLEVDHKPVQIIAYSFYTDGGVLAAETLVNILRMLKMIVMPSPVLLWNAQNEFDEDGNIIENSENGEYFEKRLQEGFHDIVFYSRVLKENPYKN